MERTVATQFELIDPPELIEMKCHQIDDGRWNLSYPFAHFLWHSNDFWLIGKMVWRNTMAVGDVHLRRPRGKNVSVARITVHPHEGDLTFTVSKPRYPINSESKAFTFVGFAPRTVVNIDFVRDEDKRLSTVPFADYNKWNSKAPRPPAGHVV
jgi:hypothetical protein